MSHSIGSIAERKLIQDTEQEARKEAIKRVVSLFQSTDSLSRLEHYRDRDASNKEAIDQKLRTLVQSQLNEISFSLGMLQSNVSTISGVRQKFEDVVEQCKECRKLLNEKDYPSIRAIRTARKNVESTIKLLKIFRDIPKTAESLKSKIDSDEISMNEAYLELKKLFYVRDKAFTHGSQYSSKMTLLFETQFVKVKEVASVLETKVFSNIADCVDLAGDDPSAIVSTLMVIEMEDRSSKLKIFSPSSKSMRERSIETLEQSIADYFGHLFEKSVPKGMEEKVDDLDVVLHTLIKVGYRLINEIGFLYQYVIPCFPPGYKIGAFFESRYTKWLYSRLFLLGNDLTKFSSSGLLDVILWIEEYIAILQSEETNENADALKLFSGTVVNAYISREREKNAEWLTSIVKNDWTKDWTDHYVVSNNCLMTSSPTDLFSMLNLQIQVAESRLNGTSYSLFVKMCCKSIADLQDLQTKLLTTRSKEKDEEFLCAMINNGNFCKESALDLQERCSDHLRLTKNLSDAEIEDLDIELEEIFDHISDGFVGFSTIAVEALVGKIIDLINVELLPNFFTKDWLKDSKNTLANNATATFEDYFGEFRESLSDPFYFAKILHLCLSRFMQVYIARFVNSKPDLSNTGVFSKMEQDVLIFEKCFSGEEYSEFISERYIKDQTGVLEKLRSLASADEEWIPLYFDTIHDLFGDDGGKHLNTILQLRPQISNKTRSQLVSEYRLKFPSEIAQDALTGQDSISSGIRSIGKHARKQVCIYSSQNLQIDIQSQNNHVSFLEEGFKFIETTL